MDGFCGGDWLGAVVFSDVAIEALLLWAIQQRPGEVEGQVQKSKKPLNRWDLAEYVPIAAALILIGKDTVIQCDLARDFRNLVHPGKSSANWNSRHRGMALAAIAAAEMVGRDLSWCFQSALGRPTPAE